MIYNLYIFDKHGTCILYNEWNRLKQSGISREEESKLMYGSLFSIKSFVSKMSPIDPPPVDPRSTVDAREGFLFYKTNKYCLHFFESLSGLKFVLNTDLNMKGVRELLKEIYKLYVEYVVRNPFCVPGNPICSDLFKTKLDEFIKQSS